MGVIKRSRKARPVWGLVKYSRERRWCLDKSGNNESDLEWLNLEYIFKVGFADESRRENRREGDSSWQMAIVFSEVENI